MKTSPADPENITAKYNTFPDLTGKRISEGGLRLTQRVRNVQIESSQNPLVSVITVVYNAKDVIEKTIQSVLSQKYSNIEYIIIDGGSDDGTLEIIENYQQNIDYFISEPDGGIYQAMNKGISLAHGDYLCLLNSGDYYRDEFLSRSVDIAQRTSSDIVYSAINWAGHDRFPAEINAGILLYHMNINHMTFLVSKKTYDVIGPYDESYALFSDDIWTRTAYLNDAKFTLIPDVLVDFSGGGLSAGDSHEKRELIYNESVAILRRFFPFLNRDEALSVIQSRFDLSHAENLLKIFNRYSLQNACFSHSLKYYVQFALENRDNYVFSSNKVYSYLDSHRKLAEQLDIPLSCFRFSDASNDIIRRILSIGKNLRQRNSDHVVLHYVRKFSSPSETFIYDLINRLDGNREGLSNIVLCDERFLEVERGFNNCITIDWDNTVDPLRRFFYELMFSELQPTALVSHFALNGWEIHKRLQSIDRTIPTLHMTHGIDVFSMDKKPEYRDYILDYASVDPQTHFTAVSDYLASECFNRGIPKSKVSVVSNSVHPRFFQNRKTSGYFNRDRALKIINVARLVDWKGHSELLEGVKYFSEHVDNEFLLTIVYGGERSCLDALESQAKKLGVFGSIEFVEFIDFESQPDYFAQFDLHITASKYSTGPGSRSETFGMATLEAIASGLTVIVTDAGASQEVVGASNQFAEIVPHSSGLAIGKAILHFYNNSNAFTDNIRYAQERLAIFSNERQVEKIREIIIEITEPKPTVAVFSSLLRGGAGNAARRVHRALLMNDFNSDLFTRDTSEYISSEPGYKYLSPDIGAGWEKMQSPSHFKDGYTMFSTNEPSLKNATLEKIASNYDVINIHWNARFLSAENIACLSNMSKPLVFTIRDMHPLTAGCHYFHGCGKWKSDCYGCPQLLEDTNEFTGKVMRYKMNSWNKDNITIVTLSQHSANIVRQSPIFQYCNVETIFNPIDLVTFSPRDKAASRSELGIDSSSLTIFYTPSYASKVKGGDELIEALTHLKKSHPKLNFKIVLAGSGSRFFKAEDYIYPAINLGPIRDDDKLAKIYSACDVTIVPSLEETFSNTAAESIACGTPVVGFETGAIPEISGYGKRGQCVPVGDVAGFSEAIFRALSEQVSSNSCRAFAEENFLFSAQGEKYTALFNSLIQRDWIRGDSEIPSIAPELSEDRIEWMDKSRMISENKLKQQFGRTARRQTEIIPESNLQRIKKLGTIILGDKNYARLIGIKNRVWYLFKYRSTDGL